MVSGGAVTISSETVFKPGSNVIIQEYQTLTSTLKYETLKKQILTSNEIRDIVDEIKANLYDYKPIIKLRDRVLNVYPTPVKSLLYFAYENNTGENIFIEIYNVSGQLIAKKEYSDQVIGQNTNTLNVSSLDNGFYIIKLVSKNNKLTSKLVKQ